MQQFLTLLFNLAIIISLVFLLLRGWGSNFGDVLFLITNALYVLQDFTYYLILLMISLFYSIALKINLFLTKALPFSFSTDSASGDFSSSQAAFKAVNNNSYRLGEGTFSSERGASAGNSMLLAALFLHKTLVLLPKLDFALPNNAISHTGFGLLRLVNMRCISNNTHILLHGNSSKKLSIRGVRLTPQISTLENNLSSFYVNQRFSKVATLSLDYQTIFNLGFGDFKLVSANLKNNLLLGKQARWF